MTGVLRAVGSVEDLFRLGPLERLLALINGDGFDPALRAEPIVFDISDPIYGYGCAIKGCRMHSTQAGWWCTGHAKERHAALRAGVGEAAWRAAALPLSPLRSGLTDREPRPACRFCPDRDVASGDLCVRHAAAWRYTRRRAGDAFDEAAWAARQRALPGAGPCRVQGCPRRADLEPGLCPAHRRQWLNEGQPSGAELDRWLDAIVVESRPGDVSLAGLAPLLAAEIRYGLWAHTKATRPARWHAMWLRTLTKSCAAAGVGSLVDLDLDDTSWTPQPGHVVRIVRQMRHDLEAVYHSRSDTRDLGYIDPNYWGFRFPGRRGVFDLTVITQRWLRDLAWDYLADLFNNGPGRPRTAGPVEQIRRSLVCFSAFLLDREPQGGDDPASLTEATAREFVADYARRVTNHQPLRGVFNVDGSPSRATQTSYTLAVNGLRRVMRWALDTGVAEAIRLPRAFIVSIPRGGTVLHRNPRPFSDEVLREVSDPANIALLDAMDPHDVGLADVWSIQVRCGRRIGEILGLRWDCVSEHLGRTWLWVDMTKVGKLDYAIQIPRDVYDTVHARQAKTLERFRLKHGSDPTVEQRRRMALFPSRVSNPTFERPISSSRFTASFRRWIESDRMNLPGLTTHQARHTLATRLINAGASMAHVKRVLGHVSERMSESYVLIAGSQVEPFLQQVWVTGPGNPEPGRVVLTPTEDETAAARDLLVDLAAIPTEHGLCTFKPVVGGVDCPFGRDCHNCEHLVLTGADYGYWKRQEQRWAALAEGAPHAATRDYIYTAFEKSSRALTGLEKALVALGLLDDAKQLDLRSPHQDFFDPIWTRGWRAGDLVRIGANDEGCKPLADAGDDTQRAAS